MSGFPSSAIEPRRDTRDDIMVVTATPRTSEGKRRDEAGSGLRCGPMGPRHVADGRPQLPPLIRPVRSPAQGAGIAAGPVEVNDGIG